VSTKLVVKFPMVKVFKSELPREVTLDELMSDNVVVPADVRRDRG
jgi:hypothetical protein